MALDWAGDRIREQSRALDEVSVLTRAMEDVLEPRGVGPVSELDEAGVEELLERLRTLARDLSSVVRGEREDDTP